MEFRRRNRTHLTSLPREGWHVFFISEEALARDFRDRKRDYFTLGFSGHTTSAECTMCQRTIFLREEELVCKRAIARMKRLRFFWKSILRVRVQEQIKTKNRDFLNFFLLGDIS
ncbi:hypothetical protein TNCT_208271 [Trichonephila clavata]|uniref:Uncharacterized protein n=1 Tax=Trichonephila clavata TaxID=2740835 RepID=A0A8X6M2B3_TRICU|nr:hypothetical protein TNCT_208271 [Trichonephila clavata]